jgi:hypothetical protein
VAFGDGITLGEDGNTPSIAPMLRPLIVLVGREYPTHPAAAGIHLYGAVLQVINQGLAGEHAGDPTALTAQPLHSAALAMNPEAVLIMEGSNDLLANDATDIKPAIDNLRAMIRTARGRNIRPYIATVPPMNRLASAGLGGAWCRLSTIRFALWRSGSRYAGRYQRGVRQQSVANRHGRPPSERRRLRTDGQHVLSRLQKRNLGRLRRPCRRRFVPRAGTDLTVFRHASLGCYPRLQRAGHHSGDSQRVRAVPADIEIIVVDDASTDGTTAVPTLSRSGRPAVIATRSTSAKALKPDFRGDRGCRHIPDASLDTTRLTTQLREAFSTARR